MRWLIALLLVMAACSSQELSVPRAREVAPVDTSVRRPYRLVFESSIFDSITAGLPVLKVPLDTFTTSGTILPQTERPAYLASLTNSNTRHQAFRFKDVTLIREISTNRLFAWDNHAERIRHEWQTGMRPGEFRTVVDVVSNDSLFAVSDYRNNRIQVFDDSFMVVRVLPMLGRSGLGAMAMTGSGMFSFAQQSRDSLLTWKFVRQNFDWSLPDTFAQPIFANLYPERNFGSWARMSASRDFIAIYMLTAPYVLICDDEGESIGLVALEGSLVEEAMANYRRMKREAEAITLPDGSTVQREYHPFFISGVQVSADGWLTIIEESGAQTRVFLPTMNSASPQWERVRGSR